MLTQTSTYHTRTTSFSDCGGPRCGIPFTRQHLKSTNWTRRVYFQPIIDASLMKMVLRSGKKPQGIPRLIIAQTNRALCILWRVQSIGEDMRWKLVNTILTGSFTAHWVG